MILQPDDRWISENGEWLLRSRRLATSTVEERREIADEALRDRDWLTYIRAHDRPRRADALLRCREAGLRGREFWRLMRIFWRDSLIGRPSIGGCGSIFGMCPTRGAST